MKNKLKSIILILSFLSIIIFEILNQYYYAGLISRGRYFFPLILLIINTFIIFKDKDERKRKTYLFSAIIFFSIVYSFFLINRPIMLKHASLKLFNEYNLEVELSKLETLDYREKAWGFIYNDFPSKYIFNSKNKKYKFIVDTHSGKIEKINKKMTQ